MGSATSAAFETLEDSIALGRSSLRPVAWILVATAVFDFIARTVLATIPSGGGAALDPSQALAGLAASELMLLDVAILAMVSLLLLPIQDGIVRGQAIGPMRATAILAKKTFPLTVSGIVQGAIIMGPPILFLIASVAPVVAPVVEAGGAAEPEKLAAMLWAAIWRAAWRSLAWLIVTSLFLLFAWPFLIFENRGPIRSIGLSISLVVSRGGREWSRFLAVLAFWAVLLGLIMVPPPAIRWGTAFLPRGGHLGSILSAAWTAATSVLALVWWDAGLVTLFRRLVR